MTQSQTIDRETGTQDINESIRKYWNERIHDMEIARHPVGTKGFFEDLDEYRFEKLDYLPRVVDFASYAGKKMLEIGCGVGTDLARFAEKGAIVTGIDLAETSIKMAQANFEHNGLEADFRVMDGENLEFDDGQFDVVYAHGVLQYANGSQRMIDEARRVLKPGGEGIFMVYNTYSWLYLLSKVSGAALEHEDAPVFKTYSIGQFKQMLSEFSKVEIIPERFPVKTRLHKGLKAKAYNTGFVGTFNLIPKFMIRRFGWHIMAKVTK